MKHITDRQKQTILAMSRLEEEGERPSIRITADALGVTYGGVAQALIYMAKKGLVARPAAGRLNYTITHWGRYQAGLPVCPINRRVARRRAA